MTASPVGSGKRSADDWIHAGYAVLADEGIKGLKLDRLCRRLGVTKGSFYWHFTDMTAYRTALVTTWAQLRDRDRSHFADLAELPPRRRLSAMMATLLSARQWNLERAMREWARTDPEVAESVRTADQLVLAAVRQAFVDAGFEGEDADVRAQATFAAGIGFLHLSPKTPDDTLPAHHDRFLDLLFDQH
ncbi:TetR/AcrR family transcriptional regulator [Mycolicibacterium vaccae]|uniref:TetR/AcrR family transcriptional regulator n=1 Tax=Mycolicibacterium vaccae TaxID=1810 RepID=UPI003CEFF612